MLHDARFSRSHSCIPSPLCLWRPRRPLGHLGGAKLSSRCGADRPRCRVCRDMQSGGARHDRVNSDIHSYVQHPRSALSSFRDTLRWGWIRGTTWNVWRRCMVCDSPRMPSVGNSLSPSRAHDSSLGGLSALVYPKLCVADTYGCYGYRDTACGATWGQPWPTKVRSQSRRCREFVTNPLLRVGYHILLA